MSPTSDTQAPPLPADLIHIRKSTRIHQPPIHLQDYYCGTVRSIQKSSQDSASTSCSSKAGYSITLATQAVISWILYAYIGDGIAAYGISSVGCTDNLLKNNSRDPKLLEALVESRKGQAPYAGAFLLKDEAVYEDTDEKKIYDLKGKELYNRLHEVGILAQITRIQGDRVILIGHRKPCSGYHQLKKMTGNKIFAAEEAANDISQISSSTKEKWEKHAEAWRAVVGDSAEALLVEKIRVEQQRLGVDESDWWEMKEKGKKRRNGRRKRGLDSWPQY
ncbi:unnamed protein product [Fraxinus pennsylvanica]|uniref:Uncharacterized protein n=1 Tax=Fraxinus pennsylvanica TaxID=56036 RepID=A0AAD1ZRC4_9LAMI|nr:unnamed protein product [Fraxinus pennsylvanica]